MKRFVVWMIVFCCVAVALSACSDPKKASKANFEKVLKAHYAKQKAVCFSPSSMLGYITFPVEIAENTTNEYRIKKFEAMVSAGLLSKTSKPTMVKIPFSEELKEIEVVVYDLTSVGKEYVITKTERDAFGKQEMHSFCFGEIDITSIDSFTEPATAMMRNVTISEVQYTYKITDVPKWAQDSALQAVFPNIQNELANTKGKDVLVLMGDGWIHEDEFHQR